MKKLAIIFTFVALASCEKERSTLKPVPTGTTPATGTNTQNKKGEVAAKINERRWSSAAKTTTDGSTYLAAINGERLQIKTFGRYTDSTGSDVDDQLAISLQGVNDTGMYMLTHDRYVVYNELTASPRYYTSQLGNVGYVHITSLTSTAVSGTFQCTVDNTSGNGTLVIKEGTFENVLLQ